MYPASEKDNCEDSCPQECKTNSKGMHHCAITNYNIDDRW